MIADLSFNMLCVCSGTEVIKTFMINSAEHEFCPAPKC